MIGILRYPLVMGLFVGANHSIFPLMAMDLFLRPLLDLQLRLLSLGMSVDWGPHGSLIYPSIDYRSNQFRELPFHLNFNPESINNLPMIKKSGWVAVLILLVIGSPLDILARQKSPAGASVFIISPKDGETVKSPFTVRFGIKGMKVAPAGRLQENSGHHHLLIDVKRLPNLKNPIPKDDHHRHFGGGETSTQLTLPPGRHTLRLLLGDLAHIPHNPPVVSKKITITVEK